VWKSILNEASIATQPSPLLRQIGAFAIIGSLGFVCDAGLTLVFADLGASPLAARAPAALIAVTLTFLLNRSLTFAAADAPIGGAALRYAIVSCVGTLINYGVYAGVVSLAVMRGLTPNPVLLTFCVACGSGVAMVTNFIGFRAFAFARRR
jgi:putative flippase GtrA